MTNRHDMVFKHLKDFAPLTDRYISNSQPFWKARKINKGDFFNMQSIDI
jgi:hypothetical protein